MNISQIIIEKPILTGRKELRFNLPIFHYRTLTSTIFYVDGADYVTEDE